MTVGHIVSTLSAVLPTQSLSIKPSGVTTEWSIRNVYLALGSSAELYRTDGTNFIKLMNLSNSVYNCDFLCSLSQYITVKNVGSTTLYIAYDGVITVD